MEDSGEQYLKGRGAQFNPKNRFIKEEVVYAPGAEQQADGQKQIKTQVYLDRPKSILNKVSSPDLPMQWSMNPYQGCEHGCAYCYARNAHEYWGFSAGTDFEQKIIVKKNAPQLLARRLSSTHWQVEPIALSGNTDCYQPLEERFRLTRGLLEVGLKFGNPVGIITKNSLIERDLDVLKELASEGLVHVHISLTTLNEDLRRQMEPRTASGKKRLKTIERLSNAGIPVGVMLAPLIPSLNTTEIPKLIQLAAEHGALSAGYNMVRLNGAVGPIFQDWLHKNFPDRSQKVWNQIASLHGQKVNDSRYGRRRLGSGALAEIIRQQFTLARRNYLPDEGMPPYRRDRHRPSGSQQLF